MAAFVLDPLAASPFTLLDARSSLHLVTDVVHEDDVLCLALAYRPQRMALWACFPARAWLFGDEHASRGRRLRTRGGDGCDGGPIDLGARASCST